MRFAQLYVLLSILVLLAVRDAEATQKNPRVKNVLMIVADDLRANTLGCYGDRICQTPNLDALAKQGMVFERAYCQGTSCAPSRRSFMFSRYQGTAPTNLGQHFRENGFYSARVGKIYHMRVPGDIIAGTNGLDVASSWTERFNAPGPEAHTPGDYACLNLNIFTDDLQGRQSTKMPHRMFVTVKYDGDGSDQADHKAATKAIELLEQRGESGPNEQPFFLAVGFVRPHYPMVAPKQYFEPYSWQKMKLPPQIPGDLDDIPKLGLAGTISSRNPIGDHPDNQQRMWAGYYAAVTFMDEQVGRLIEALERNGLRESTAVVFTSDHGYHLGDHQFWQKSNLHEQVLRVPLILSVPDISAGRTQSLVELVDIFPTLSELAGLDIPKSVQGRSLVPILRDPTATIKDSAISFNKGHSLRTDRWHFMRYNDGTTELYDMERDPQQITNRSADPQLSQVIDDLARKLDERLGKVKDLSKRKK
ncbi:MAG: sulfatase [Planctomycetaceae bacterium]|nr:sulfatase [Planctomycetaceae bacterium]